MKRLRIRVRRLVVSRRRLYSGPPRILGRRNNSQELVHLLQPHSLHLHAKRMGASSLKLRQTRNGGASATWCGATPPTPSFFFSVSMLGLLGNPQDTLSHCNTGLIGRLGGASRRRCVRAQAHASFFSSELVCIEQQNLHESDDIVLFFLPFSVLAFLFGFRLGFDVHGAADSFVGRC